MKYKIKVFWSGPLLSLGRMTPDTQKYWQYIKDHFGGDEDAYWQAVDKDEVPQDMIAEEESFWNHTDIFNSVLFDVEQMWITRMDTQEDIPVTDEQFKLIRTKTRTIRPLIERGEVKEYFMILEDLSGIMVATIDVDQIDFRKLSFIEDRILMAGHAPRRGICGIAYDGRELDADFDSDAGMDLSLSLCEYKPRRKRTTSKKKKTSQKRRATKKGL